MDEVERKEVVLSIEFHDSLKEAFLYGEATFGQAAAKSFIADIYSRIWCLDTQYLMYPECRHLVTTQRIYRNIIIGSYLIVYRITSYRIEVLSLLHSSVSVKRVKSTRKIKPDSPESH